MGPEVYIRTTLIGLDFGYEAIQWDGAILNPTPNTFKKHTLTWNKLNSLNKAEQQDIIINLLTKTINTRKRQYRKCEFCSEKVAFEHRFDNNTCHACASNHYGVVY